jgi:hypothetical protein
LQNFISDEERRAADAYHSNLDSDKRGLYETSGTFIKPQTYPSGLPKISQLTFSLLMIVSSVRPKPQASDVSFSVRPGVLESRVRHRVLPRGVLLWTRFLRGLRSQRPRNQLRSLSVLRARPRRKSLYRISIHFLLKLVFAGAGFERFADTAGRNSSARSRRRSVLKSGAAAIRSG